GSAWGGQGQGGTQEYARPRSTGGTPLARRGRVPSGEWRELDASVGCKGQEEEQGLPGQESGSWGLRDCRGYDNRGLGQGEEQGRNCWEEQEGREEDWATHGLEHLDHEESLDSDTRHIVMGMGLEQGTPCSGKRGEQGDTAPSRGDGGGGGAMHHLERSPAMDRGSSLQSGSLCGYRANAISESADGFAEQDDSAFHTKGAGGTSRASSTGATSRNRATRASISCAVGLDHYLSPSVGTPPLSPSPSPRVWYAPTGVEGSASRRGSPHRGPYVFPPGSATEDDRPIQASGSYQWEEKVESLREREGGRGNNRGYVRRGRPNCSGGTATPAYGW
ncbi:unnamed protein product, partial [Discosporangium mesarthrocarpum]